MYGPSTVLHQYSCTNLCLKKRSSWDRPESIVHKIVTDSRRSLHFVARNSLCTWKSYKIIYKKNRFHKSLKRKTHSKINTTNPNSFENILEKPPSIGREIRFSKKKNLILKFSWFFIFILVYREIFNRLDACNVCFLLR
jgi:hypothetical protein